MKKIISSILCCLSFFVVLAQDPMANQFNLYKKTKPTGNLFVHFDKNVYSSNETIWFSGYLVQASDIRSHRIMSVSLIKESDNKVVLEDRFIMQNGFAFGNFILPDSIVVGNYRLLAITDHTINKLPEVSFTQPITIKSALEPPFKASMKLMQADGKSNKVMISATTADNRFLAKPASVSYSYGSTKKNISTDASGQAIVTLPVLENLEDPNLYVKLGYDKDSTFLNMPITQPKGSPEVKFYPEGGNIVNGLINNIGWEAKDRQKKPVAAKAYLYKNNIAIDTIKTNVYGLGTFKIFAEEGAKYTLKIASNTLNDTLFTLPKAFNDGITLNITNAVATDTIKISLRAKRAQQLGIRIHNFRESYLYTKFDMQPGTKTLKIPLAQVPKGLASLTITNADGQPLAERIFFAHYDNTEKISISSDKTIYGAREKVNLKLKLKNINENAVVSVAVVQDNRMEFGKITDIESHTYLNNELANIPINVKGSTYKDQKYLEQLLLIKGWRRYQWQDMNKITSADTTQNYMNLLYTGTVTKGKKPLTKAIDVGAMGDEKIRLITTTETGIFDFNTPQLYTASGKKMFMFLNKNNDGSHKFSISNQLLETSQALAKVSSSDEKPPLITLSDNSDLFIKSNEKSIRLKEVTISGNAKSGGSGPNACGDYVCPYGILNCRNHYGDPNNRQPVQGETYKINGQSLVYQGCNVTDESIFFKAEGIHIHKEFYIDDYKDPLEPAYFSTIYWNYGTVLNKDKETSIDFYTSDIVGKYRVVIQGITQNQVIFNEKFFEVKRK